MPTRYSFPLGKRRPVPSWPASPITIPTTASIPQQASSIPLTAEFAGLGGYNKFARYTLENTWFHPLYKKVVFSTKLVLGYVQEVEGQLVPIDEKFYLGGIYSLTGFKARTVCPVEHLGLASAVNGAPWTDQVVYLGGNKEVNGECGVKLPHPCRCGGQGGPVLRLR